MRQLFGGTAWGYDLAEVVASLSDITEEHFGDDSDSEDGDGTPAHFMIDEAVRMEDMIARLVRAVHLYPPCPKRV